MMPTYHTPRMPAYPCVLSIIDTECSAERNTARQNAISETTANASCRSNRTYSSRGTLSLKSSSLQLGRRKAFCVSREGIRDGQFAVPLVSLIDSRRSVHHPLSRHGNQGKPLLLPPTARNGFRTAQVAPVKTSQDR